MKKYLVMGLGKSGISAAKLLSKEADVTCWDIKPEEEFNAELLEELKGLGIKLILGTENVEEHFDECIISPGIRTDHPVAKCADALTGELELAYENCKGTFAAITGTNGKTTVTTLVGLFANAAEKECIVAGNIGTPVCDSAQEATENTLMITEVSSFQLETIKDFHPHVSAILNLAPDHLDRHGTAEEYYRCKCRIFENQTEEDYLVYNLDDEETVKHIQDAKCFKVPFTRKRTAIELPMESNLAYMNDKMICVRLNGKDYEDYLTGGKSNRFNYASVYYNQRGDVHPPLYYIFLHTVCSVLEGKFTKWTGLGLNMVFMAAALVFIYEMCKSFLGGRESALTVTALYGISSAIMSVTVYIRMYALLTLITMICAYLHLSAQDRDYKLKKRDYLQLGGIVLLGYLTHYYFVLFILALAAVTTILMLVKKKYKPALFYVLTMAASGVTGLIVWPFSIRHVFSGYRGDQAFESLKSAYSFYKLNWNIQTSLGETAGKIGLPVAVLTIIAIVVLIILKKKKFPYEKMLILLIPSAFAVIVVSQICPFYSDRYLSNISPFFLIIPVYILTELVKAIQEKTKTKKEKLFTITPTLRLESYLNF